MTKDHTEGKLTEAPLTKIEIMKRLRKCKADLESHTFQDKKINGRTCGKNIFGEKNEALFCDECKENMFQLSLARMALEGIESRPNAPADEAVKLAIEALEKMLLAACWFHEGPYGPSPDLADYRKAQKTYAALSDNAELKGE